VPKYLIYPMFTAIFAFVLIATVPKTEIRRLSIYGIIFGGIMDVIVHIFGHITGLFSWINYGPFAFKGISIFASVAWAIFFILYFYFLPKQKPLNYIFVSAAIGTSVLYYNLMIDLGIFGTPSRMIVPILGFTLWFGVATWGFYKLNAFIEGQPQDGQLQKEKSSPWIRLSPQPARKIEQKEKKRSIRLIRYWHKD